MTIEALIKYCNPVRSFGTKPEALGTLVQDSRKVANNSVFIAVRGLTVNGHTFIEEAIANGAGVIICEEYEDSAAPEVYIIQVSDTRALVGPLAQAFEGNPGQELTIIGITGTNGKTTVATLTYQVLQELGASASLLGTVEKRINDEILESRLTTSDPIELARDMRGMVNAGSTHLVMEVSSHALSQQRVQGLSFGIAAFTNLSHDHLDYHTSVEAYAKAKKQLFDDLPAHATAVINADDEQSSYMVAHCEADIILFSFETEAGVSCSIEKNSSTGLVLQVDGTLIKSPMVGRFNAYNIAQAFLICQTMGYEPKRIAEALADASGAPGRLERVQSTKLKEQPLVLVDYAHTPGALENVLSTLAMLKREDQMLHVIFGCGGDRDKTKRPRMAAVVEQFAGFITITSDNPRTEDPDAIIDDAMKGFKEPGQVNRITDRRQAIKQVIAEADTRTIILIAGKGHETYQEINGTRYPFDDRKIARHALDARTDNAKKSEVR